MGGGRLGVSSSSSSPVSLPPLTPASFTLKIPPHLPGHFKSNLRAVMKLAGALEILPNENLSLVMLTATVVYGVKDSATTYFERQTEVWRDPRQTILDTILLRYFWSQRLMLPSPSYVRGTPLPNLSALPKRWALCTIKGTYRPAIYI